MNNDNYLYNWLFHYNPFMNRYFAFHSEDFVAYMNGQPTKYPVIKSTSQDTLMKILQFCNGDPSKIENDAQDRTPNLSSL